MTAQCQSKYAFATYGIVVFLVVAGSLSNRCFAQECSDPVPPESACTAVRALGEMDRCACFVCFAANGSRGQTVCTRDRDVKESLLRKRRR
jgi:hypothetical protein